MQNCILSSVSASSKGGLLLTKSLLTKSLLLSSTRRSSLPELIRSISSPLSSSTSTQHPHHLFSSSSNLRYFPSSSSLLSSIISFSCQTRFLSASAKSSASTFRSSSNPTTTSRIPNKITGHDVTIEGLPIHYEKAGHGPHVLLLLPGALGAGRTDFAPQLEALDPALFTMIAWDPPGYGRSVPHDKVFDGFYRSDAEVAAKLMKTLKYPRYSVLGWSDGGITGMIIAASPSASASIQKLIIWGSNAYVNEEDRTAVRKVRNPKQDWSESYRRIFIDMYGEDQFYRLWDRWVAYYMTLDDICKGDLPKVKCPVLIAHGDQDPMLSAEHPVYLVNQLKNSTLYRFPKGKHNIHQRYAAEFNTLVEDFLTAK